ncbi:MAG: ATP-binding protein [Gammaproteobacteria bacterium]|nr:ATP-binding protein [Gammaproteobacteria bacterium]
MSTNSRPLSFDSDPHSVTNFVDRMHGECARLQWLRELVVNSIEAVAATGEGGSILVHAVDQDMGDGVPVRKLAVTDTGEGIARGELYSSFRVAMTSRGRGNFGIGAKVAALPLNPAGMIYRSKVTDGEPAELIWHKTGRIHGYYAAMEAQDPATGQIEYATAPTVEPETYARITDAGHGTQVVLCGERPADDTCRTLSPAPSRSTGNLHWAIRELNFKFWRIPKDIELRVENARANGGQVSNGRGTYIVHGAEAGLKDITLAHGTVDLAVSPYRVRWFLLKEKARTKNQHNGWSDGRILGTLFHESTGVVEVYALRRHRAAAGLMNDFGIYTGAERVVLLVDPKHQDRLQPTTARNDLRIEAEGNVSGAYKEIGQEFASLMADKAQALAEYVREQLEGLKSTSDEENLKEVIARVAELFRIKDYRRLARGRVRASDDDEETLQKAGESAIQDSVIDDPGEPSEVVDDSPKRQRPQPRPRPRPRPLVDGSGRQRGEEVPPDISPKVFKWTSLGNADDVTDYVNDTQHVVSVNTDGETYVRLLALYNSRPDFAEHPEVVEQVVRSKCEAWLQLCIYSVEREFRARRARLGTDFDGFLKDNSGRVCLDGMASKEVHDATAREIRNQIQKAKSQAAAEARAAAG